MSKSNGKIRILNATAGMYTSAKNAVMFLEQGRARYVDERTIEMLPDDHRHQSAVRSHAGETRQVEHSPTPFEMTYQYAGPENLRTFAPYPDVRAAL